MDDPRTAKKSPAGVRDASGEQRSERRAELRLYTGKLAEAAAGAPREPPPPPWRPGPLRRNRWRRRSHASAQPEPTTQRIGAAFPDRRLNTSRRRRLRWRLPAWILGPLLVALPFSAGAEGVALTPSAADAYTVDMGYAWVDATAGGATLALGDDQVGAPINLPFEVSVYGLRYSRLWVSSNGWLAFEDPSANARPTAVGLPSAQAPAAMVAAFWEDLDPSDGEIRTDVSGVSPGRVFAVTWRDMRIKRDNRRISFQVQLFEDAGGLLSVHFQQLDHPGPSSGEKATIGLQDDSRTRASVFAHSRPGALRSRMAIAFTPARREDGNVGYAMHPSWRWLDLDRAANLTSAVLDASGLSTPVSLGFAFSVFGAAREQMWISEDGWVAFEAPASGDVAPVALPSVAAPAAMLAALWEPLSAPAGSIRYGQLGAAPFRVGVVEWRGVQRGGDDTPLEFQLALFESSNQVLVQYRRLGDDAAARGGTATVGYQGAPGGFGNTLHREIPAGLSEQQVFSAYVLGDALLWQSSTTWLEIGDSPVVLDAEGLSAETFLPFFFPVLGQLADRARVSSDGWLAFSDATTRLAAPAALPAAGGPSGMLAPYWDRLDGTAAGAAVHQVTLGATPSRVVVYEWRALPPEEGGEARRFQLQLHEAGARVHFAYQSAPVDSSDVVIGFEAIGDGAGSTLARARPKAAAVTHLAPRAELDGPWVATETVGGSLALSSAGSTDADTPAEDLELRWDLDGDGDFDDATGAIANLDLGTVDGPATLDIGLRVSDPEGNEDQRWSTLTLANRPPEIVDASVASPFLDEGAQQSYVVDARDVAPDLPLSVSADCDAFECRFLDEGAQRITVTVADDDGGIDTQALDFTVRNVAPQLVSLRADAAFEGAPVNITAEVVDPGEDPVVVTRSCDPSGCTFDDEGEYTVTVTAMDDEGATSEGELRVTVQNVAPEIVDLAAAPIDEGGAAVVSFTLQDPGNDTVTATRSCDPAGCVFADDGNFDIEVTADDGDGGITRRSVVLVVRNVPPTIISVAAPAIDEGQVAAVTAETFDPGDDVVAISLSCAEFGCRYTDEGDFTVTVTADDGDGGIAAQVVLQQVRNVAPSFVELRVSQAEEGRALSFEIQTEDPGDDTLVVTRDCDLFGCIFPDDGPQRVTVRVEDGDGGSAERALDVAVANVAPVFQNVEVLRAEEGAALELDVQLHDPGDDTVTLTRGCDPQGCVFARDGAQRVTLTARDEDGGESVEVIDVQVANLPPEIASVTVAPIEEGETATFVVSATDPGGDPLTIHRSCDAQACRFDAPGEYEVTVEVRDDAGASAERVVTVQVNNVPPRIVSASAAPVDEGDAVVVTRELTNVGEGALVERWDCGSGFQDQPCRFEDQGLFSFTYRVEDEHGGSDERRLDVQVLNRPPQILRLAVDTPTEGVGIDVIFEATDVPADEVELAVDCLETGRFDAGREGSGAFRCLWSDNGPRTVTGRARDEDGGEQLASVDLIVDNAAPVVTVFEVVPDRAGETLREGDTALARAEATDVIGDTLSFAFDCDGDGDFEAGPGSERQHRCSYPEDGVFDARVVVSDEDGGQSDRSTRVTVINVAPTLTGLSAIAVDQGQPSTINVVATDPGPDALRVSADCDGDGHFEAGPAPLPAVTCFIGAHGSHQVPVLVDDGDGGEVRSTVVLVVRNQAPRIDGVSAADAVEGGNARIAVNAWDPGGEALSYAFDCDGDGTLELGPQPSAEALCPFDVEGERLVNVEVRDPQGASAGASVRLQVSNAPPVIHDLRVPPGDEGDTLLAEVDATDPGGDLLRYRWDCDDDGSFDGVASADPTQRCHFDDDGLRRIVVEVSDGDGGSVLGAAEVQLSGVAPVVLSVDAADVLEGAPILIEVEAEDPAPADVLSYLADCDGDDDFEIGPQALAQLQCPGTGDGSHTIAIEVRDDDGLHVRAGVTVEVSNLPPVVDLRLPVDLIEGETRSLSAIASDPGGDALTYFFDCDGDGDYESGAGGDASVDCRFPGDGEFEVGVEVRDDAGATTTRRGSVSVANAAPTLRIEGGENGIREGESVVFTLVAADPGGDALSYLFDCGGDGELELGPQADPHFTCAARESRPLEVVGRAVDDAGAFTDAQHSVAVRNVAPTLELSFTGEAVEGGEILLSAAATDPGGDLLLFRFDCDGDGVYELGPQRQSEVTCSYASDGARIALVEVDDGDGGITSAQIAVEVANLPPELALPGLLEAQEGGALLLIAEATDPGGDPLDVAFDCDGDGAYEQEAEARPEAVCEFPTDGRIEVGVRATDDAGAATEVRREVEVANLPPQLVSVQSPLVATEGEAVRFVVQATDPGGDPLRYAFDCDDDGEPEVGPQDAPEGDCTFPDEGMRRMGVRVLDDAGAFIESRLLQPVINAPPVLTLFGPEEADEGTSLTLRVEMSDPGEDTLRLDIDCDGDGRFDGRADLRDREGEFQRCQLGDDGRLEISGIVRDGDGGEATHAVRLDVLNLAPQVPALFLPEARPGEPWQFEVPASDPAGAADPLSFGLVEARSPAGMQLNASSGVLTWTPPVLGSESEVEITVRVSDDDGGVRTVVLALSVDRRDEDNDGLPDAWERATGLDPTQAGDAAADPDGDGLTNTQEAARETDPRRFDGPSAPQPVQADALREVLSAQPVLAVLPATDPDGDPLSYGFEIYADADLSEPVFGVAGLAATPEQIHWEVDEAAELEEHRHYWWRARANDGFVDGPFGPAREIFVNASNDAPSTPRPELPVNGAVVQTHTPMLQAFASEDIDEDALRYELQLATRADFTNIQLLRDDLIAAPDPEDGVLRVSVMVPAAQALREDLRYHWRLRAIDEHGLRSNWSEAFTLALDQANAPPDAPALLQPAAGSMLPSPQVVLTARAGDDPDGSDRVTLSCMLSDAPDYPPATTQDSGEMPLSTDGVGVWSPDGLLPGGTYYWRCRSSDGRATTSGPTRMFRVRAANLPPEAPTPRAPGDGAVVDTPRPQLSWDPATDPDGDALSYRVEIRALDPLDVGVTQRFVTEAHALSAVPMLALEPGVVYGWTLRALDPEGAAGPASAERRFTVEAAPTDDAPADVKPGGCSHGGGTPSLWLCLALAAGLRRRRGSDS